jgi:putative ABC transport system permease protein
MIPLTLFQIGRRYLSRHPWQSVLMIVGISLGVAVVVAIDLANASASRAFDLSAQAVTGRATHQIVGGPEGLDESIYARLRRSGMMTTAAPVISDYLTSPQLGGVPLQLLGIDPFVEAPFRDYLGFQTGSSTASLTDLTAFLTEPGAIFIASDLASQYHLLPGAQIKLDIAGHTQSALVAGLLKAPGGDTLTQRALQGLILADIATAQELTGRIGKLDRIDLILPTACQALSVTNPQTSCPQVERLRAWLPEAASLQPVAASQGAIAEMTAAFRLNLTALSLLALVVGVFLIYNTMTFSVLQRRPLFGTLRCLGVTRREIFMLVISEAILIGLIGTALGLALGTLMGLGAVRLVTQTINDLYFTVTVRGVQIPASSLVKGSLLGVIATVLTAVPPAWEAASVPPRLALSRSSLEHKAVKAVNWAAVGGATLLLAGTLILLYPSRNLVISFVGTFVVIIGFALLTPLATKELMLTVTPLLGSLWGSLGRMAPRDITKAISRTSIAVAALMVAVSVSIGVGLMVSSFRGTVITWLNQTLQGDIYLSVPGPVSIQSSLVLDPRVIETVKRWPGVLRTDVLRSANVNSPVGLIHVAAANNPNLARERIFLAADGTPQQVQALLQDGAVLVSEPLANRLNLPRHHGVLTLDTDQGAQVFTIAGIYYDYSSSQGTVMMTLATYRKWWQDDSLTAAALHLAPGTDPDQLSQHLSAALAPIQQVLVRPNQALRRDVLAVFDRTFAITGALQLLATVVAFIGILNALLSLQLERQRDLGVLRAVGLTRRQLWGLVMGETSLMGAAAGILAMPTGFFLAVILIYIINRRSFGWTLQLQVNPALFIQALAVAVVAALLAGLYPAYRMGIIQAAEAVRFE